MLIHHKLMAIRAPLTERNLRQYSSSKLQFHGDFAAIECMSGCCLLPVGIQGIHSARSYVLAQAFGCRSFSAAGMNASCCPNWGSHMSACTMLGSNGAQIDHTSKQGHYLLCCLAMLQYQLKHSNISITPTGSSTNHNTKSLSAGPRY
jgi:hypothetical protein